MTRRVECDIAIAGAGLAGGLIALALARRRPDLDVRLVDAGDSVGGNHIWSFFDSDVGADGHALVDPLIEWSWPGYYVAFPRRRRLLATPYHSIPSARLDAAVRAALPPERLLLGRKALAVGRTAIALEDGARIEAKAVIDARGVGQLSLLDCGWQKFVGQVVRLAAPHGLDRPVVMDATVRQFDGYRFVYLLPLGPDRLLIEDTYYSDGAGLDHRLLQRRIADYAEHRGWTIAEIEHEESGVLPVAMGGDFERYWQSGGNRVAKAGARAGLFHAMTGYTLPLAVETALTIAALDDPASGALHDMLHDMAARHWEAQGFYRLLARMLFRAGASGERYRVMQRFYGLDAGLIARFYAGASTRKDKARVLIGKPPVPFFRALGLVREAPMRPVA